MVLESSSTGGRPSQVGDHATKPNLIGAFDQRQAVEHDRHDQQNFCFRPLAEGQAASGGKDRRHHMAKAPW